MDIGKKIRQLRLQNDLTLEDLASRSELTKGFLSQLERDLTSPSISTLEDILEALGTNLSEFFHEEEEEQIVFTNKDFFVDTQDEYQIEWIVPNAQKNAMEPVRLTLRPGGTSEILQPHSGEEFGYVIKGSVRVNYGGKYHSVKSGESFYFKAGKRHFIENKSNGEKTQLASDIRAVQYQLSLREGIEELHKFDDDVLFPYVKDLFNELESVIKPSPMV